MQRVDKQKKTIHGDTIIEVVMAFATFAAVAMFTIDTMNRGLNSIQRTLETTMARNAIDSQADALRFIHNNFLSERNFSDSNAQYLKIWNELKKNARNPRDIRSGDALSFDVNSYSSCEGIYKGDGALPSQIKQYKAFVVNPRFLIPEYDSGVRYGGYEYSAVLENAIFGGSSDVERGHMETTSLYPRIIYGANGTTNTNDTNMREQGIFQKALSAQGIWNITVYSNEKNKDRSEYYDFYIRTCWNAAGMKAPSTITTIVRLYNPEVIE